MKAIDRREFLKKFGLAGFALGGGFKLLTAGATTESRPRGPATALNASELRDQAVDNMFAVNLAVKKNEKVLVFTDDHKPLIMDEAKYVAKRGVRFGEIIFYTYSSTGLSGMEPPKGLWEKAFGRQIVGEIEKKKLMRKTLEKKVNREELETLRKIIRENRKDVVDVVIGLAWYSTSHTNFRKLLTDSAGARYASMPAFDPKMWQTAMSADWEEVARKTLSLKDKLSGAMFAHVHAPNGTDILLDLQGREWGADTGLLNQPGRFGNLPAGELFIAPMEGHSKGKMVIEPGINRRVKGQVIFEVKEGRVARLSGETGSTSWLENIFQKFPLARNIAEFGIGTNEKAKSGTTMLELEKILGTIHMAMGDNSTIGGKVMVPFHIDFLFENPTVEITFGDGRTLLILKEGKALW